MRSPRAALDGALGWGRLSLGKPPGDRSFECLGHVGRGRRDRAPLTHRSGTSATCVQIQPSSPDVSAPSANRSRRCRFAGHCLFLAIG